MLKKILLCHLFTTALFASVFAQTTPAIAGATDENETYFIVKIKTSDRCCAGFYDSDKSEQCKADFVRVYLQMLLQNIPCNAKVIQADPLSIPGELRYAMGLSSYYDMENSLQAKLLRELVPRTSDSDTAALKHGTAIRSIDLLKNGNRTEAKNGN